MSTTILFFAIRMYGILLTPPFYFQLQD
jgi:hypothetical protein